MEPYTRNLITIFEHSPVGLCLSQHRVIRLCNVPFAKMFLYRPEELMGKTFEILYPSTEEFDRVGERGVPIMRKTGMYCDERIMMRKGGEYFWCRVVGHTANKIDPFAEAVWTFEDMSAIRPVIAPLTPREREIAAMVISGKTSKHIAKLLEISPRTVEAHRGRLMKKLEVTNATELVQKLVGLQA